MLEGLLVFMAVVLVEIFCLTALVLQSKERKQRELLKRRAHLDELQRWYDKEYDD